MLTLTHRGLFCAAGNFYIDPNGPVERAVITHAHSDHARRGSKHYFGVRSGTELLRCRLSASIQVTDFLYREPFSIGNVRLSFHSAGHILGSAQVRLEYGGEVWVVSGDYKREADPTCEPFESVKCDVFVTEATFGTPSFRWPKGQEVGQNIYQWWLENSKKGINSVLFAYSLGKTQRVLGLLHPYAKAPIYCHPAAEDLNECYRRQGVALAPTISLKELQDPERLQGALVIAPQSFLKNTQSAVLGKNFETAFVSGWMARSTHGYDRGFLLSDHADWDALLETVIESGAKRVYVQHRGNGALVRELKQRGIKAFPETQLESRDPEQLLLL